jgi:basic membrane protein A
VNRKIAALAAAAALAGGTVLIAGCGGDDETGGGTGATTEPAVKVTPGLVTDIGGINDRSFNFLANKGMQEAAEKLGVTASVRESKAQTDYIPNIRRLVTSGSNVIITVGFLMGDATGKSAKQFPDAKFAIVDFSVTDKAINNAPNVRGLLFKEQEAGYLAGYLAGLVENSNAPRLNSQKVIGAVGGLKIPPVDRYIAGYKAGAEAASPGIKVLVDYSQDFVAQNKCKDQSLAHIEAGSDIEFQVAGQCGLGTLSAAQDKKIWGIGVDADQAYLGPHILTSALKRVDVAVKDSIDEVAAGTFKGGSDKIFDLKVDGVGLGEISKDIPADITDKLDQVKQDIIDGKITIPDTI